MNRHVVAFIAGLVFSIGLGFGGMTLPVRVMDFLDFTGAWDPTLAFVLAGAFLTYLATYKRITARDKPVVELKFSLPTKTEIDRPLIIGAGLFGVGWALAGYCPGPAITSLASGSLGAFVFVAFMLLGMLMMRLYDRARSNTSASLPSPEKS